MRKPSLLAFACLALFHARAPAQGLVDTILARYGMDAFERAEEIRFTFHVKALGFLGTSRSWSWKPRSDSVTRVDKGISYARKAMDEKAKALDKDFTNDQYWLTFPFHLAWDKGTRITVDTGLAVSPRKGERLRRVVVAYMQPGGYTPNDAYTLFVAPDGLIKEWTYHKRGNMEKGLSWTWEKQEAASGLLFAREHKGLVRIYFTDIEVLPRKAAPARPGAG